MLLYGDHMGFKHFVKFITDELQSILSLTTILAGIRSPQVLLGTSLVVQ